MAILADIKDFQGVAVFTVLDVLTGEQRLQLDQLSAEKRNLEAQGKTLTAEQTQTLQTLINKSRNDVGINYDYVRDPNAEQLDAVVAQFPLPIIDERTASILEGGGVTGTTQANMGSVLPRGLVNFTFSSAKPFAKVRNQIFAQEGSSEFSCTIKIALPKVADNNFAGMGANFGLSFLQGQRVNYINRPGRFIKFSFFSTNTIILNSLVSSLELTPPDNDNIYTVDISGVEVSSETTIQEAPSPILVDSVSV